MGGGQSYLGEKGEKGEPAVIEPVSEVYVLNVTIQGGNANVHIRSIEIRKPNCPRMRWPTLLLDSKVFHLLMSQLKGRELKALIKGVNAPRLGHAEGPPPQLTRYGFAAMYVSHAWLTLTFSFCFYITLPAANWFYNSFNCILNESKNLHHRRAPRVKHLIWSLRRWIKHVCICVSGDAATSDRKWSLEDGDAF